MARPMKFLPMTRSWLVMLLASAVAGCEPNKPTPSP